MTKKKPVIAVCASCFEQFTSMAEVERHDPTHRRIASTNVEDKMLRLDAVEHAEEFLKHAEAELRDDEPQNALVCVAIANAYLTLAKMVDD